MLWLIAAAAFSIRGMTFGAQAATATAPTSLSALLDAKSADGKPMISAAQRAYFDSLNDRLRELLNEAVRKETITRPEHLAIILTLELSPQKMDLLLQDNCVLCHTDSEIQSPKELFTPATPSPVPGHMSLKGVVGDTHFRRGLSCAGCHGGDPSADVGHDFVKEWPESRRETNRAWVVQFCARCHSEPAFMNRFNPGLPTDQLEKFKTSPHGKLLLDARDARAPDCISCHGVHGILPAKDPLSKVYARRVPETCGACHADPQRMAGFTLPDGAALPTNQLDEYRRSVHGVALLQRGDLGAPACNDCHGNHGPQPPDVADVSRSCSLCHSANAALFDGSKHRQAFAQHNWPECGQCHGNHAIARPHDALLRAGPASWCTDCHRQFARDNPECDATADYFYQLITHMAGGLNRFGKTSGELAAKGLDVDPIEDQLKEVFDSLKKSRTNIHSFNRNTFDHVAAPGQESLTRLESLVKQARAEYRTRQLGLLGSIGLIGLVMLAIWLKLRQLER